MKKEFYIYEWYNKDTKKYFMSEKDAEKGSDKQKVEINFFWTTFPKTMSTIG